MAENADSKVWERWGLKTERDRYWLWLWANKGTEPETKRRASSPPKEEGEESGCGFRHAAWTVEGWEWTLLFSLGCRKRSVLLGVSERLMANRLTVWRSHYNQQTHELRKKAEHWASKMAQWVKAFAAKAEFDRRAKKVEGENQLS